MITSQTNSILGAERLAVKGAPYAFETLSPPPRVRHNHLLFPLAKHIAHHMQILIELYRRSQYTPPAASAHRRGDSNEPQVLKMHYITFLGTLQNFRLRDWIPRPIQKYPPHVRILCS